MSSSIGDAVIAPAVEVHNVSWFIQQGGKFLLGANQAVNQRIKEKKQQIEERNIHRKAEALAAHKQLVNICTQIIKQLDDYSLTENFENYSEIAQLKSNLKRICEEHIPESAEQIESLTSLGYLKMGEIIRQKEKLASIKLSTSKTEIKEGLSVADLMEALWVNMPSAKIQATIGSSIKVESPVIYERMELNQKLKKVIGEIEADLAFISELSAEYGLTISGNAWFHSCFNGIDILIDSMCDPTISNRELKKGVKRLEDAILQYESMAPKIEQEIKKMHALYDMYVKLSKELGETTVAFKNFKTISEIEEKLEYLQTRMKKAQECAQIYQKLGRVGYICYAFDQELQAMGYKVHSRQKVEEMAGVKPLYAQLGEKKIPFYQWEKDELTELYSITSQCSLQVIVHDDGTVSMQTLADTVSQESMSAHKAHCVHLKSFYNRLKTNWFISYDYKDNDLPESLITISDWLNSENYAWKATEIITDHRIKKNSNLKTKSKK